MSRRFPVYEFIYTILAYVMGSSYWWIIGLLLIINFLLQLPTLILLVSSPLLWASLILSDQKLVSLKNQYGNFKFLSLYFVSILLGYGIYVLLRKSARTLKISNRYVILPILLLYLILVFVYLFSKKIGIIPAEVIFVLSLLIIFYSSSFVMIAFDCLNAKKGWWEGIKSFLLLNTVHSTFLSRNGTQLGPNGTSPLLSPVRDRAQTYYLRKKAIQIAFLMVALKLCSDLIGYTFLNIENAYLSNLNFPTYELIRMNQYSNIPRAVMDAENTGPHSFQLAFVVRSINWYFSRIAHINFKILLLWMLGIYIKLGVDEPWKSRSFADFFRRTHVYVAHFYRVFVYPIVRQFTKKVKNLKYRKYLSIWLMIFIGGLIFQSLSHSYQIMFWKPVDIMNTLIVRGISDSLLATFVVLGVALEDKNKILPRWITGLKFFAYILIYSLLMSVSASIKLPGFTSGYLVDYFQRLLLFTW